MTLKSVLREERYWTKNCAIRDIDGEPLSSYDIDRDITKSNKLYKTPYAFSLQGALMWYYPYDRSPDQREQMRLKIRKAIKEYTGKDYNIAEFNDDERTTFKDIKKVISLIK